MLTCLGPLLSDLFLDDDFHFFEFRHIEIAFLSKEGNKSLR